MSIKKYLCLEEKEKVQKTNKKKKSKSFYLFCLFVHEADVILKTGNNSDPNLGSISPTTPHKAIG